MPQNQVTENQVPDERENHAAVEPVLRWPVRLRTTDSAQTEIIKPSPAHTLYQRLLKIVDRQMLAIEARLDGVDDKASATSRERDTRTLTALVRLAEKINDLEPEDKPQAQKPAAGETDDLDKTAHLREQLADRIHKFAQQGDA